MITVGAGPAGLAVAGALARHGIRPVLLEAGAAVGWAWRHHYPTLRLHTTRRDSSLPVWPMPGGGDLHPGRDEYADYLERYADRVDADVRLRCPVHRVRRHGDGWEAQTSRGVFRAPHLVMASGFNRVPVRPRLPGEDVFGGPILHSSQWPELEEPEELGGRRILVVGLGNTGADLVEALERRGARVAISLRGPVHLVPLRMGGLNWRTWYRLSPGLAFIAGRYGGPRVRRHAPRAAAAFWSVVSRLRFGDLEKRGLRLQRTDDLLAHWNARRAPVTAGPFLKAIRSGAVRVLPAVERFHPGEAELTGGARHPCDAVVLATGFRPALEDLLEPEALPPEGQWPPEGRPGPLPGLWFCGYLPELLRIRRTALRIARCVAADPAARG